MPLKLLKPTIVIRSISPSCKRFSFVSWKKIVDVCARVCLNVIEIMNINRELAHDL
jgi:hypothetical protein